MTALGIIGLILGIIVMIVFAYWGLNAVSYTHLGVAISTVIAQMISCTLVLALSLIHI